jgi:ribonuclease HI
LLSATNLDFNQIDNYISLISDSIVETATNVFGIQQKSPHSKPWWNPSVRDALKKQRSMRNRYRKHQSPRNKTLLDKYTAELKLAIQQAKDENEKYQMNLINKAKSASEFWHRINKFMGNSTNNTVEPLQIGASNNYEFDDAKISERLADIHIRRNVQPSISYDDSFKAHVETSVTETIAECRRSITSNTCPADASILLSEITDAISESNPDSCPGPDGITSRMIMHGGLLLHTHLHKIISLSYNNGYFGKPWKKDNKIFIKKPDKSSYHTEKAYRPISLLNILSKIYEKVLFKRIFYQLECSSFFSNKDLHAYLKFENSSHALLPMIEDMQNAISNNEFGVTLMFDLEGAFDNGWRDGIIYKLSQAGITGKLLLSCHSYLQDRFSRNLVNKDAGNWIPSNIGFPQGGVLSALFFLVLSHDCPAQPLTPSTENTAQHSDNTSMSTKKVRSKYADDGFFWRTNRLLSELLKEINNDCKNMVDWCIKWRVSLNLGKSEGMFFTKRSIPNDTTIKLSDDLPPIKIVTEKRALGVIIDNKLTFRSHINKIATDAKKAANAFSLFNSLKIEPLVRLYKTLVRPKMEYDASIWSYKINFYNNRSLLESAQRHSLRAILKAPPSTPTSAMEAELDIPPIDLRLHELARLECLRILRKPKGSHLKNLITTPTCFSGPCYHLSRLLEPVMHDLSNKYGDFTLEPQPVITTVSRLDSPTIVVHNMELEVGSSNNRSADQKLLAKDIITNQIKTCNNTDYLCLTDGSALNNPGPTGAGAIILQDGPNSTPLPIGKSVSKFSDNIHGEIVGIQLASHHALTTLNHYHSSLRFFIDCQAVIHDIISASVPANHHIIVNDIRSTLKQIQTTFNIPIHIHWTPAHCQIKIHDDVDKIAKNYAAAAANLPMNSNTVTVAKAKLSNTAITRQLWNRRWKLCPGENFYKSHISNVLRIPRIPTSPDLSPNTQKSLIKLRINHTNLPAHKARFASEVSPLCDTCNTRFNSEHLFFECDKFFNQRSILLESVTRCLTEDPLATDTTPTLRTLLGLNHHISNDSRNAICKLTAAFIASIEIRI